jgi:hypothetical protein
MAGTNALGGYVVAQQVSAAVTAAVAEVVDSVVATVYVPNTAMILDVILTVTDMDDGSALLFDVGDSSGPETADDDRFLAAVSGQAAGSFRASVMAAADGLLLAPYTYRGLKGTDDSQIEQAIECTINTAAATGVAGTVTMTVIYVATV